MRLFLRIIALFVAFTLPVYGFAGISKDCSAEAMEHATFSVPAVAAMDGGFEVGPDTPPQKAGLDKFENGFSCSASDAGQQCQIGMLSASFAFAEPAIPSSSSLYTQSLAQVYLEQPQRPPSAS